MMVLYLLVITVQTTLIPCGTVCLCNIERTSLVCENAGFSNTPVEIIDISLKSKIRGLGLQRNYISTLKLTDLQTYPNLEVVDVSLQKTAWRCVKLDFPRATQTFKVLGKYIL